jgi:hypothetical protein
MERTEEEILLHQGVKVRLGKKSYDLKPLTMRKASAWRTGLSGVVNSILSEEGAMETPQALRAAIVSSPAEMGEAVFSYLDLNEKERDVVLDTATEDQVMAAFFAVMAMAMRPFFGQRKMKEWMLHPEEVEKEAKRALELPSTLQ